MDIEKKEVHIVPPHRIQIAGIFALAMLGLFLLTLTVSALKEYRYIGTGVPASNTITLTGEGEVFAVPDTATFSVTVQETAKDVKTAQDAATKKGNDIIAYLKGAGVEEKDIQTTDYSVYPQYSYGTQVCTSGYCPPGHQTLDGYQVSQTLTVKVKDTKKAGELLSGVGSRGTSQVSGLSFTIDDEDKLQAEARDKAIQKARDKAEVLAASLGVSIVRVVGFSENGNYPVPYAYGRGLAVSAESAGKAPPPELPAGQNKITSNVSVTYEIR